MVRYLDCSTFCLNWNMKKLKTVSHSENFDKIKANIIDLKI